LDSLGDSAPGAEEKPEAERAQPIAEVQNQIQETEAGDVSETALSAEIEEFSEEVEPATENDSALVVSPSTDAEILVPTVRNPEASHSPFASATKAHKWLQSLEGEAPGGVWFSKHRANIYVGAAVILLLVVLSGWGTPPRYHNGKNPLSLGDRLLISLGLAEAPSAPAYNGNPNTQVWVDLHTALYYCPGSDLYGKTPGGKFTTQRDAQLDQFEPAARKSCD